MEKLEKDENQSADVLPPIGNQILILIWLTLFSGRWIVISPLSWFQILSSEQVVFFDEVLLKIYLLLFVVTCTIVALRKVRISSTHSSAQEGKTT